MLWAQVACMKLLLMLHADDGAASASAGYAVSSQGVSAASCLPQSGVCLACKVDIAEMLIAGPRLFHWVCVM